VSAAFARKASAAVGTDDVEFLRRFEACALPERDWTHLAHIRVAWVCLRLDAPKPALDRVRRGILRYNTEVLRRAHRYHDTVTVAFTRLIYARMRDGEPWQAFAERVDDLLDRDAPILFRHYSARLLDSAEARRRFVPADLLPLPAFEQAPES